MGHTDTLSHRCIWAISVRKKAGQEPGQHWSQWLVAAALHCCCLLLKTNTRDLLLTGVQVLPCIDWMSSDTSAETNAFWQQCNKYHAGPLHNNDMRSGGCGSHKTKSLPVVTILAYRCTHFQTSISLSSICFMSSGKKGGNTSQTGRPAALVVLCITTWHSSISGQGVSMI